MLGYRVTMNPLCNTNFNSALYVHLLKMILMWRGGQGTDPPFLDGRIIYCQICFVAWKIVKNVF